MRRIPRAGLVPALLAAVAVAVGGCGGGDAGGGSSSGASGSTAGGGKQGGDVTYLSDGDVDYVDPGQTYYTFGFMVQEATNRPLLSFKPGKTDAPVPDLAASEPIVSPDKKTVTVKLRTGVRFSPPVKRAVTSKDVKYAIERAFTSNVPSGYSTSYFSEIQGAPSSPVKYGKLKSFAGLQTPDDQTLVIKLTKAVAPRVVAALVMPITVPVPEEYAKPFDRQSPSTYDSHVVFTGPYMIKNDAAGKLVGRNPGKQVALVRNPSWDKATDYRPAYLDSITIQEGNSDGNVSSRRTLDGSKTMSSDGSQPPPAILQRALTRYKAQLGRVPGGGTRWIALNTTVKPLDNLNVRKALVASFDRNALRQQRGGAAIGPIAESWIPPGLPGNEESGGEKGFSDVDFMRQPGGDAALAKQYMLAAGKQGVPVDPATGKYTGGGQPLLMAADSGDPDNQVAAVAQGEFEKLGFKVNLRKSVRDTMYTKFCGVPSAKAAICPSVAWFKDFNDPESMLSPTFNGNAIKPAGNVNWSQLDDKAIDEAMAKGALTTGDQRNQTWADINKMIVEQAPGIPYVWDDAFQLESKDLAGVMNEYTTLWDLSFSALK